MPKQKTKTFWLAISNLIVVVAIIYFASDYFGWWQLFDWDKWLGIKMQGSKKSWFYFGVALLVAGPIATVPLYIKRYCRKCSCRGCGRKHIQRF